MKNQLAILLMVFSCNILWGQNPFDYKETHSIQKGKTIFLSSEDAEVNIKGSNRSDVSVEIHRNAKGNLAKKQDFKFEVEEKGGNLYLTEVTKREPNTFFGFINIKTYTIDILVPNDIQLDIKGDDDNYEISNINGDISLTGEDGEIIITNVDAPNITIEIEDGDVFLTDVNGNLTLENEDGNLIVNDSNYDSFSLRTEDGDVRLKNTTTGNTKIRTEDGDIQLDIVKGDLSIAIQDGDIKINELHAVNLDIDGEDGNVELSAYLSSDSDYEISLDDGQVDFYLLGGGGSFKVKCDDGNVNAHKSSYQYITDEEHYKVLETKNNGNAKVEIRTADGNVRLGK